MKNRRILVIDDCSMNRKLLQSILPGQVYTVDGGRAALSLPDLLDHDAVITDLEMPCLYGDKVVEYLKEKEFLGQILGMSGSPEAHHLFKAAGVHEFFSKPLGVVKDLPKYLNDYFAKFRS